MDPALREDLLALSRAIHADPELGYQERRAADRIAALLERRGHHVERGLGGIDTSFRARIGPPGPSVALLAEYDALPEIGHACGHNLIAMSNVGAFLLAASDAGALQIGIALIGTPAEERGGGKIALLRAGAFDGVAAALSSHGDADARWLVGATCLGTVGKRVTFHGVAAHAAASPEQGRNALSAAIRLFTGVDAWRQHLPATTRVHGIITNGGAAANVIPDLAECSFGLRAKDAAYLREMEERFADIARGAALQTGTTVDIADTHAYLPLAPNTTITGLLAGELGRLGVSVQRGGLITASTDLGDVSQQIPTDHIGFPVTTSKIAGHSIAMREASIGELAHRNALLVADALAGAARRLATDATLRGRVAA